MKVEFINWKIPDAVDRGFLASGFNPDSHLAISTNSPELILNSSAVEIIMLLTQSFSLVIGELWAITYGCGWKLTGSGWNIRMASNHKIRRATMYPIFLIAYSLYYIVNKKQGELSTFHFGLILLP